MWWQYECSHELGKITKQWVVSYFYHFFSLFFYFFSFVQLARRSSTTSNTIKWTFYIAYQPWGKAKDENKEFHCLYYLLIIYCIGWSLSLNDSIKTTDKITGATVLVGFGYSGFRSWVVGVRLKWIKNFTWLIWIKDAMFLSLLYIVFLRDVSNFYWMM